MNPSTIDWNVIRQEVSVLQDIQKYWVGLKGKSLAVVHRKLTKDWQEMGEVFYRLLKPISGDTVIPVLVEWLTECNVLGSVDAKVLEERNSDCRRVAGMSVRTLRRGDDDPFLVDLVSEMVRYLADFMDELKSILDTASPERLTFLGFRIDNPNRVPHAMLVQILDSIKYVVSLFKKKGVTNVLADSVKSFRISLKDSYTGSSVVDQRVLGRYWSEQRLVELIAGKALKHPSAPRMLKRWVDEILVHEIGHHVHMSLLHPEAVASWDRPWQDAEDAEKVLTKELETKAKVSLADRLRYFDLAQKQNWDLSSVAKTLAKKDPFDKQKFLAFLRMSTLSSKSDQVRLTPVGKWKVEFAKDPQKWAESRFPVDAGFQPAERERQIARGWEVLRDNFFFLDDPESYAVIYTDALDFTKEKLKEEVSQNNLKNLSVPTDYAQTNKYEDFAETFVAFLTRPDMISDTAKFRMQRALSLSGLYGKEIMKVGKHTRKACIIAAGQWGGHLCLLKNRDRNYTPKIKVIHELIGDVEVAYFLDTETDWSEGMNEHGFAIVNSALQVKADENERKNIQKGIKKSKDGERIREALSKTTIEECIKAVSTFKSGVKGHTFVTDGEKVWSIEQTSKHENITEEIDPTTLHVRTNHGHNHEDAGYSEGENLISSLNRREKAEKVLRKVKSPERIAPSLMDARKDDRKDPNNLVRATDNMRTSSQLVMDADRLRMWLYIIPEHAEFVTIENKLPKGRTPKIKVQVFEYTKTDKKKVGLDKVSSVQVQTVVERYLNNKAV